MVNNQRKSFTATYAISRDTWTVLLTQEFKVHLGGQPGGSVSPKGVGGVATLRADVVAHVLDHTQDLVGVGSGRGHQENGGRSLTGVWRSLNI